VGTFFYLDCPRACGYIGSSISIGIGGYGERALRRCAVCGDYTDVLVARIEGSDRRLASGRGRCPSCRSQRLRPISVDGIELGPDDDIPDGLPCPTCGGPLDQMDGGLWD
jgi:hypothetical protein